MPTFDYAFTVPVSLAAVRAFHHDTRALKKLTPPPVFAQIHSYEPLAEGSRAEFTLWFGPLPLHWVAHVETLAKVPPHSPFPTQARFLTVAPNPRPSRTFARMVQGPLAGWRHTHRFTPVDAGHTRIHEHIEYEHKPGLCGWFTRLRCRFCSQMLPWGGWTSLGRPSGWWASSSRPAATCN